MLRQLVQTLALAALVGGISAGAASPAVRVVGGTPIQVQSAPWSVYVQYQAGPSSFYHCTGSIVDASHVVTAAHCLYDIDGSGALAQPAQLMVDAGVSNFYTPTSSDLPQVRSVGSFRIHPGYVYAPVQKPDDVAVLTLASPLDLSGPAVRAVALPAANAPFPAAAPVVIAGFGRQDPAAPASGALESMTAAVDPQGACGDAAPASAPIADNGILACTASATSAVCSGDSGSGVVTTGPTPVLVGVVDASTCAPGSDAVSTYVGAPEILRFVQGDDAPPTAPRPASSTSYRLSWDDPPEVGETLTCSTTGWPEPVQVTYSFLDAASGQVLQTGRGAGYLIPASAVGTSIVCEAAVTGAGGTTLVRTSAASRIEPATRLAIEQPGRLVAKRGWRVTLRVVLRVPPGRAGSVSACATPPPTVGRRSCRSGRRPAGPARKVRLALVLEVKPTAPLGTARVAVRAAAGRAIAMTTVLLRVVRP